MDKRDDTAANVSHELANAMGAIIGWARLAKKGMRVQEALDLIEMSADSAWSAAQRLLGETRDRRDPKRDSINLSAFVEQVARLLEPKATAKNIQVRTVIEPGLWVRGNRGSAWSIVWNLALNAIEALPQGGAVELRLGTAGENVLLVVEDNGPGMNEEQQRRAFERHFTTKATGTGIGLALVKQTVTDLDGSVELHSQPGLGARFSVALPIATERPMSTKRSSGVFYAEPIHQRILVVDDDVGLREMIATALQMRGAEVVAVANAQAALRQSEPFAIAIVDLLLPDARGDELIARLRQAKLVEISVLVTGTELPSDIAPGGMPDVTLRKPFELEEFFECITAALGAREHAAVAV